MSQRTLQFDCRFTYAAGFTLNAAFELGDGISALFGPSGSGKSTCLALIAGLLRPASGNVRLGGAALVDIEKRAWVAPQRRRLGVVFQSHLLFPHMSVRKNLAYGMPGGGGGVRFDEAVDVLDLGDLLERYPAELSGGQQRRVALGRAVLSDPKFLLMDEPLTGLDASLRDRILDYLQRVHAQWRLPMLLVSHDQVAVRRLAQRVVVLDAGRVVAQGPVETTLDRATIESMADHPGPINLLRIEHVKRVGDHSEGLIGGQRFYVPNGADEAEADMASGTSGGDTGGGVVYVRCLPRDVALTRQDVPGISMRNHLRGTIRDMIATAGGAGGGSGGGRVYVGVDVGQLIWAELTPGACRELELRSGVPVVCLIKATAAERVG